MLKSELIGLLEGVEDTGTVDELLQGTDLFKGASSLDVFKGKLESDKEFASLLDGIKDKHFNKALETWKANNLDKIVQAKMLENNPQLSPAELKIQELEKKFADMEKAKAKAEMIAEFKDKFNDKKIPTDIMNFLLAEDKDVIEANITVFENSMQKYIDAKVEERVKGGSYVPPAGKGQGAGVTKAQFDKFNYTQRIELLNVNPELYHELSK